MVAGRRQAMDSAPVKANASMDSLKVKEVLQDGDDYTGELTSNEEAQTTNVSSVRKKQLNSTMSGKPKPTRICPAARMSVADL